MPRKSLDITRRLLFRTMYSLFRAHIVDVICRPNHNYFRLMYVLCLLSLTNTSCINPSVQSFIRWGFTAFNKNSAFIRIWFNCVSVTRKTIGDAQSPSSLLSSLKVNLWDGSLSFHMKAQPCLEPPFPFELTLEELSYFSLLTMKSLICELL